MVTAMALTAYGAAIVTVSVAFHQTLMKIFQ